MPTVIKPFFEKKNDKENPLKYLKDLNWVYEQNFATREPIEPKARNAYINKTFRIIFRQNLRDQASIWYNNLNDEIRANWTNIKNNFLLEYTVTPKNAQQRKFELLIKMNNLKQTADENIADYLRKTESLTTKLPVDDVDVDITTLKNIKNSSKLNRITFECNKNFDFNFAHVSMLIKIAYSEVDKINP